MVLFETTVTTQVISESKAHHTYKCIMFCLLEELVYKVALQTEVCV